MSAAGVDLKHLQQIIYRLVTAPGGVAEGLAQEAALPIGGLAQLVVGDDRMSPDERVEVYANGYFYRLLEVLKEDYPATLAVVGDANFHNLATGYLIDYPPSEPSIHFAGANFAAYLATHPLCERWPFLGDLARLERATLESFHAANALALDATAMRALSPAEWPALTIRLHPAARLIDCGWRVDAVLQAVESGVAWTHPDRDDTTIIVWRREARVYYRALETAEREALRLASVDNGTTFAAICESVAAGSYAEGDVADLINRLLARWLLDGILIRTAE
jgi:Putative DNA-binding domain